MYRQFHVESVSSDPVSAGLVQRWASEPLSDSIIGQWCRVAVRVPARQRPYAISITFDRTARGMPGAPVFLTIKPAGGEFLATGIIYVPGGVTGFVIASWGQVAPSCAAVVHLKAVSRATAA